MKVPYLTTSKLKAANSSAKRSKRMHIDDELIASLPTRFRFPIFLTLPQEAGWIRISIGLSTTKTPAPEELHILLLDVEREMFECLPAMDVRNPEGVEE